MRVSVKLLILSLLCLYACFCNAQVVDFTFTPITTYCNPQNITFTQNCTGNPQSFIWNFGNGQFGNAASQSVQYVNAGTYTINLTAVYANNAITVSKQILINPSPTVLLSSNADFLCKPGNITLNAGGTPGLQNYDWQFGDGSAILSTNSNTVTHNYTTYGTYLITLVGTSANGCMGFSTLSLPVKPISPTLSITPDSGCIPINALLNINATLPNNDALLNYTWDFGDGTPIITNTTTPVNHNYNVTNVINTASVKVTTTQGCVANANYHTFGYGIPPTNTRLITTSGRVNFCGNENISFSVSAQIADWYDWDFGDGTIVTHVLSPTFSHKYRGLGFKQILVTPYLHGCKGIKDSITIKIIGVIANYDFRNNCTTKNNFSYSNSSLGNISWFKWVFSDIPLNPDYTNFNTMHTFPQNGAFTTGLYILDSITGCTDSLITKQYTAHDINLFVSNAHSCKDSLVEYRVRQAYKAGSNYIYDFYINGAHFSNNEDSIIQIYPHNFGSFNNYVIVNSQVPGVCADTLHLSKPDTVFGPVIDFTASSLFSCQKDSIQFSNFSHPFFPGYDIINWQWSYGDGLGNSKYLPPLHNYSSAGTYTTTLSAMDKYNCIQKKSILLTIYPTPIVKLLIHSDTLCLGDSAQLIAYSSDSIFWSPSSTIHYLTPRGDTVQATPTTNTLYYSYAINSQGCMNKDSDLILVYSPFKIKIIPADTTICPNQTLKLTANHKGIYLWSPATYLSNINNSITYSKPDKAIQYKLLVVDSAGCFRDSTITNISIYPIPIVNAGMDQLLTHSSSFTLNPIYSSDVVNWQWSPASNNLSCFYCPITTGIAEQSTNYILKVTNNFGCINLDTVRILISCDKSNLLLPNAFSPNNDGLNDWFYPITYGFKVITKFIIYNRWGEKFFERQNFQPNKPQLGWNGISKNSQSKSSNVFVWLVEGICDTGEIIQKYGTVTLVK